MRSCRLLARKPWCVYLRREPIASAAFTTVSICHQHDTNLTPHPHTHTIEALVRVLATGALTHLLSSPPSPSAISTPPIHHHTPVAAALMTQQACECPSSSLMLNTATPTPNTHAHTHPPTHTCDAIAPNVLLCLASERLPIRKAIRLPTRCQL